MARVLVGIGGQYPSDSTGIIHALQAEHRELVFTDPDVQIFETIDLDSLIGESSPTLTFEGAGVQMVNFKREGGFNGLMVKRTGGGPGDRIRMLWDGITLQGQWEVPLVADVSNNMKIAFMENSLFEECAWRTSNTHGLVLGENGDVDGVTFRRCGFDKNARSGLVLQNTRNYVIEEMCFIHRNALVPGSTNPGLLIDDVAGEPNGGNGTITGNLFESDDTQNATGIQFGRANNVQCVANRWVFSDIRMTVDTEGCYFADNSVEETQPPLFPWKNPENTYERNDP